MIYFESLTTPAGADDFTFSVYFESKSSENISGVKFGDVILEYFW